MGENEAKSLVASALGRLAASCGGVIVAKEEHLASLARRVGAAVSVAQGVVEELVQRGFWARKADHVYVDPTLLAFLASCRRVNVAELFERLAPKGVELGELRVRDDYYAVLSHPHRLSEASFDDLERAYVESVVKSLHERKYFTREGDWGLSFDEVTGLWVPKFSLLWEFFGKLDEVESLLTYAAAVLREKSAHSEASILERTVDVLFDLGSRIYHRKCCLDPTTVLDLEQAIAQLSGRVEVSGFKKAYRKPEAALLAFVRASVRGLERLLLELEALSDFRDPNAKRFLNRLSSLLFVLAVKLDEE